jgi:hypothetical protein
VKGIRSEDYGELLKRVLQNHGLPKDTVMVVDSIYDWCHQHGLSEGNPNRTAKAIRTIETGKFTILLPKIIREDMIDSVKGGFPIRGHYSNAEQLDSQEKFLMHLLLHEIAEIKGEGSNERERDEWAFNQMGIE